MRQAVEDLEASGPGGVTAPKGFGWFEITNGTDTNRAVTGSYHGKKYMLLMTLAPMVMLADDRGRRMWGLKRVYAENCTHGTVVACEFDAEGAKRLEKLTQANLSHNLAILMDDRAIADPRIKSALHSRAIIDCSHRGFDTVTAQQMVDTLTRGMPPVQ
jgi:preprotein translocase subunit SecD